jgi:hypothetical protein
LAILLKLCESHRKEWLNDPELEDDFRQDAYKKPTMMLTNNKLETSFTFRLLTLEFIGGCFQVFWRGSRLDQTFQISSQGARPVTSLIIITITAITKIMWIKPPAT